jgi:hypothetical protein
MSGLQPEDYEEIKSNIDDNLRILRDAVKNRLDERVTSILSSPSRDDLIKGLLQDLNMYIQTDLEITKVVRSERTDTQKVEMIKDLVMYME